jgi:hypothetical protein
MSEAAATRTCGRLDRWRRRLWPAAGGLCLSLFLVGPAAPLASASMGYEPASPGSIAVQGEEPQGVAIDQASQDIYVAIPLTHFGLGAGELKLGQVDQLSPSGAPTAASPFAAEQERIFSGVAVNPVTQGVYAVETGVETPIGTLGTAGRMDQFSALGTPGTEFSTGGQINEGPRIAADSSGRVFVPSSASGTVLVFSSSGVLQETISCAGCPGGEFQEPVGVALDSQDDLYVVDLKADRVVKLVESGGSYSYSSLLQSGKHAATVGVDPSTGSVFVGDYPAGGYHIVAYSSSGVRFDDFGAGIFAGSSLGAGAAGQIAVNATTHKLYASDPGADVLRVFELVTIHPPTATTDPASPVGQVEATMKATVNANFHATTDCHFEYATDAAFQANGFNGAPQAPCSPSPDGSSDTPVSARVPSLPPQATYHYRVVAANDAGSVTGGAVEFTTLPEAAATVTTEPATAVTSSVATLHGKVNTHGGTVTGCQFEYGVTQSYGKTIPCPGSIGVTSADVSKSGGANGLAPATTYHYRFSVTTNAGAAHGGDVELTTLSPPSEEQDPEEDGPGDSTGPSLPSSPPPVVSRPPAKRLVCRRGFRKRRVHGKLRCVKKRSAKRHRLGRAH